MNRFSRYITIRRVVIVAVLAVLGPYLFSRAMAPGRRITKHRLNPSDSESANRQHPGPADPLKIACYNIAHGRGLAESNWNGESVNERADRLKKIGLLLRDLDADVVVLNEVDFDCSWSHHTNQAAVLAKHAGYEYWAEERNLDFRILGWTWRFGNAILSRYPIKNARVVDFDALKSWERWFAGKKRGIACDIAIGNQTISVIGVHLSHRSEELRVKSAQRIAQEKESTGFPVIVAGDFNSTPENFPGSQQTSEGKNAIRILDATRQFQRHPTAPPVAEELTFRADKPKSVIDWILLPTSWSCTDYQVVDSLHSDHRPVMAAAVPKKEPDRIIAREHPQENGRQSADSGEKIQQ